MGLKALSAVLLATATWAASAAPVADALQRPAVMVRDPARSVLLHAAWAGERIVAVGERGIVVLSDDHGKTWRQVSSPVSVSLTAVRFAGADHGIAIGHGGVVLSTTDGGANWRRRLDGKQLAQLAFDAARASGNALQMRVAEQLKADGADKPFFDLVLFDAKRLLVIGAYGLAFYSEDGGERWTPWMERFDNPKGLHLYAARQRDNVIIIAGEQGMLLRSIDHGKTFQRLNLPYKGSYFTAELLSSNELVVAGLRGNIWRSIDSGSTWTQLNSRMPASVLASTVAPDGAVLLANQAGIVLRAHGDELTPLNQIPLAVPSGVLAGKNGRILTVGFAGVIPVQPVGR